MINETILIVFCLKFWCKNCSCPSFRSTVFSGTSSTKTTVTLSGNKSSELQLTRGSWCYILNPHFCPKKDKHEIHTRLSKSFNDTQPLLTSEMNRTDSSENNAGKKQASFFFFLLFQREAEVAKPTNWASNCGCAAEGNVIYKRAYWKWKEGRQLLSAAH